MNATSDGKRILITVSRRNLLALLQKVDLPPGSSHCSIQRQCNNGMIVTLRAEPDAVHYGDRQPGSMRGDAETAIKQDDRADYHHGQ